MNFINKLEINTDNLPIPEIREKKKITTNITKKVNEKNKFRYLDELLDKDYINKYFNDKNS